MALPEDAIRALQRIDRDLAWAVVKLLEQSQPGGAVRAEAAADPDLELVSVAARRSLIVVNRSAIPPLPGVTMIPLHGSRAFLALDPGCGLSELELAILDRLGEPAVSRYDAEALARMRTQVARWRHDRRLAFHTRAIIVVERVRPARAASAVARRGGGRPWGEKG